MSEREYRRLSPRGRRRAAAARVIEGAVIAAGMFAAGYAACVMCYVLQVLAGVAG